MRELEKILGDGAMKTLNDIRQVLSVQKQSLCTKYQITELENNVETRLSLRHEVPDRFSWVVDNA